MSEEVFKRTDVATTHEMIPLHKIKMNPQEFAFRSDVEYKLDGKSITELAEELFLAGMLVEVLVERDGDDYLLWDGHRRIFAGQKLVQGGKWAADKPIPAQIVVGKPSQLERLLRLGAVNNSRRPWEDGGMIRYAGALSSAKCPVEEIARVMGKSVKQVRRYLLIFGSPWALKHVEDHNIDVSKMSTLLAQADAGKSREVFTAKFDAWVATTRAEIAAENQRRDRNDQELLSGDDLHPKKHLKAEIVAAWKTSLKTGVWDGPSFRFKALISEDPDSKKRMVQIDRLNVDVDQLTLSDVIKIYRRCFDMASDLEPVILEKKRLEELQPPPVAGIAASSAAAKRLAALGLSDFVDDESFTDGDEDDDFDVVESDEGEDLAGKIELPPPPTSENWRGSEESAGDAVASSEGAEQVEKSQEQADQDSEESQEEAVEISTEAAATAGLVQEAKNIEQQVVVKTSVEAGEADLSTSKLVDGDG